LKIGCGVVNFCDVKWQADALIKNLLVSIRIWTAFEQLIYFDCFGTTLYKGAV
jgi:hypothetical protein